MKNILYFIGFVAMLASSCTAPPPADCPPQEHTTLFVVRHAEKENDTLPDPSLSIKGKERARQLKIMLASEDIAAVYTTPYRRTHETIQPLADTLGLPVTEYDARLDLAILTDSLLSRHSGEKIVVVGHSNTVPNILNALLLKSRFSEIPHDQYGDLFIISLSRKGEAEVTRLFLP